MSLRTGRPIPSAPNIETIHNFIEKSYLTDDLVDIKILNSHLLNLENLYNNHLDPKYKSKISEVWYLYDSWYLFQPDLLSGFWSSRTGKENTLVHVHLFIKGIDHGTSQNTHN